MVNYALWTVNDIIFLKNSFWLTLFVDQVNESLESLQHETKYEQQYWLSTMVLIILQ